MRRLSMLLPLVVATAVVASAHADPPKRCKPPKKYYAGKCRYADEIERLEQQKKKKAEAKRKKAEEARRKAEQAQRKAEAAAKRKAEAAAKAKAEQEAKAKAEQEAKNTAEEAAARLEAEEAARRKAEEEAKRQAEETARLKAELESRVKADEAARRAADEEAKRKAEQAGAESAEEARHRRLMQEYGLVHVVSEPPGALLVIDGAASGAAGSAEAPHKAYLSPGEHRIRFALEGRQTVERRVTVTRGELAGLTAMLPTALADVSKSGEDESISTGGWIGGALAAVGLGLGIGAVLMYSAAAETREKVDRLDKGSMGYSDEYDQLERKFDDQYTAFWALTGTGAAALLGGLITASVAGGSDGDEPATVRFEATVLPGGLTAGAVWDF